MDSHSSAQDLIQLPSEFIQLFYFHPLDMLTFHLRHLRRQSDKNWGRTTAKLDLVHAKDACSGCV